ncbi:dual specificity phosphatase catalytic domain protein [Aspergillus terreus]|uniref:phosphatidylinositol-3,4,5-trisphosphate 3-phosphatase n=1 Tax=Aspergillus terreus TaxID=33178 RepID=A0A5M3YL94_ASPTE|nr:hypothetical protein ATETN484_0001025700 [Aspergillus terreus]GFF12113.1 dual specificity phosphatase catalytic domain protein [Aspergillus terreus]
MQLTSLLAVALSTLAAAVPVTPGARADSPSLTWHVSNFDTGCSPGGCVYTFNISGVASQNTPGFNTHCNGTTTTSDGDEYTLCDDKHVKAQVVTKPYPVWNVKAQHSWFTNQGQAEFFALGQTNVTSSIKNFTIPVTEVTPPPERGTPHHNQVGHSMPMPVTDVSPALAAPAFIDFMASILRQIVAGPRLQHPEAGLDLCYVTDNIIATSGPSANYPQRAYRNPLDGLVRFLDAKHGENWCIWEFRAEGTGYPDDQVYGRIHHYPFPDHHPPPFALIPAMMGSMKNWLHRLDGSHSDNAEKRVAVVHCKAGKGRSGTVACSYLISQEGWKMEDALQRFTERRMRAGFGAGVSIPSQLRWVGYVDRWTNGMNKLYVERPVEILELHVWGLRDGVKVAVEGFVDEGKKIKCFHLFHRSERTVVEGGGRDETTTTNSPAKEPVSAVTNSSATTISSAAATATSSGDTGSPAGHPTGALFRPKKPVILPTSDVNIDFERRSKAAYTGWAMVTSIAHVWFNAYFEGGDKHDSGVFEAEWDALDGIKGTTKKGIRALDRVKVVWRYPHPSQLGIQVSAKEEAAPVPGKRISEPKPGETIPESHAADWRGRDVGDIQESLGRDQENIPIQIPEGGNDQQKGLSSETDHPLLTSISTAAAGAASAVVHSAQGLGKELGLRKQTDESQDVSLAESDDNSPVLGRRRHGGKIAEEGPAKQDDNDDFEGVRPYFGDEEEVKEPSGKKDGPSSRDKN